MRLTNTLSSALGPILAVLVSLAVPAWAGAGTETAANPDEQPGSTQTGSELTDELEALLEEFETEEGQAPGQRPPDYESPEFDFFSLGTTRRYMKSERFRLHDQIMTFIPPLYQPAFVGHAYVLPPKTWRVAIGGSGFDIETDDFFKGGSVDFVHDNHTVSRQKLDFDLFYGLDRDFTVRVNVPFWTSQSAGSVHPAGVRNMDLFVEGTTGEIGDVQVFVKKKFWDQANRGFNFAAALGLKLPTGANDEKFDAPMVVRTPMGAETVAFGGGAFPRFTDDGRLPSALQPGTGALGYLGGLFVTRQFSRLRGALHVGALVRILDGKDGVEPGDELRFFASFVKPVYQDYLSLEIAVNGMRKDADSYEGTFTHPVPDPVTGMMAGFATTPRPAFQEGTVVFASPSLILIPNPWLRITATVMFRLNDPELGPWPQSQFRLGTTITF